jgi:hypothetical protein
MHFGLPRLLRCRNDTKNSGDQTQMHRLDEFRAGTVVTTYLWNPGRLIGHFD